jgi:flagellar biosynthesis protein FliQ
METLIYNTIAILFLVLFPMLGFIALFAFLAGLLSSLTKIEGHLLSVSSKVLAVLLFCYFFSSVTWLKITKYTEALWNFSVN